VTVTDANLVLGRIPPDTRLGGRHALDLDAAVSAMDALAERAGLSREQTASGVIRIANEHMSRALRVMSAERGIDPARATLMSFGGAGGLHVCELAESLGMTDAVVPARSGVLSALGMLVAEPGRQATSSFLRPVDSIDLRELEAGFDPLASQVTEELEGEGVAKTALRLARWVDCRYAGQSATLELPMQPPDELAAAFHEAHESAFGHRLDIAVEVVGLRVEGRGPARIDRVPAPAASLSDKPASTPEGVALWPRSAMVEREVQGPAIVADDDATTWVAPGWTALLDAHGHLRLLRR